MSIKVSLNHVMSYEYSKSTKLSPQVIRLRPAPHTRTPILTYSMKVLPGEHFINWQQDPFGNHLARVVFPEEVDNFSVEVNLVADLVAVNPFDFFLEPYAEKVPFTYSDDLKSELSPYMVKNEDWTQELLDWKNSFIPNGENSVDYLINLTQQMSKIVDYEIRYEPGVQTSLETLTRGAGSCRDSAWFLVETLRHLGFASRFVSGYLVQLVPDEKPITGPAGPSEDFTDLHAWAEVYLPGAGWIGFDPTSGLAAGEGHIPLVATPNPSSSAPITGTTSDSKVEFNYTNTVTRLVDEPRSTRPYNDSEWQQICEVGKQVDKVITQENLKMTVGGEPTFVSAEDLESAQWNTDADGQDKRILSYRLIRRLRNIFSHKGIIQLAQGKWYPGEVLPRWEMNLVWRKDGVPMWSNEDLLANPNEDYGHDYRDCEKFIDNLADELGISSSYIMPAYEDPVFAMWRENSLPLDYDEEALSGKDARLELLTKLEGDVADPSGFVLPLDRRESRKAWLTSSWPFGRSRLFLVPGSSPIGLRLPMDSLPSADHMVIPEDFERDPFERLEALPKYFEMLPSEPIEPLVIRKALSCEARGGVVRVFIPPFQLIEHGLSLISRIESVATKLEMPVVIEGYPLPSDRRIERLSVTPDPGVIEVNIHPSKSFAEMKERTQKLYYEARQVGLATEKFHLDGRHTGTGGGNHITIGGVTPEESPLIKNPELLCGIIRYWQNHPSLSYLFSGLFVGPTSQAPRVDEARLENLHELEIALSEIETANNPSPWLADRALRHLLTDLTGNTHRAELCIDKLFSPDHARGRLGLLELRAFEMPPHYQMSALCSLLVSALVARISKSPYRNPLVRWGSDLHDRFMLPHYLAEDMSFICKDLNSYGFKFDPGWFEPFFAFRFPRFGTIIAGDVSMELRAAIEPWLVLGEEMSEAGTARYVDSSMERIQIRLFGFNQERYEVRVNDVEVPLRSTGRTSEFVAGIRYRAWHPPSALHPTIGVHTPLSFEIIDKWSDKVIGAAKYHVSHPGGRSYDILPVNALEAESRRQNRFDESTLVQQGSISQESLIERDMSFVMPAIRSWVPDSVATFEAISSDEAPNVVSSFELDLDFPTTLDLRGKKSK